MFLLLLFTTIQAPAIEWTPYNLRVGEQTHEFPLGRLSVPENHAEPGGPAVQLAFLKLPATTSTPGPPIVWLAGGPGGSGIGNAGIPYLWELFSALRSVADVILLDQRGTGRSQPSLTCPAAGPAPFDLFETRERFRAHFLAATRRCAEHWRGRGVRPEHYTTTASADDLDRVRRGLGVEKVSLVGFSYGTHLALSAIRRHGDRIHRVVVAGVEGPAHNEKLPAIWDLQLHRLAWYARNDSTIGHLAPDLVGSWRTLLDRLDREPMRISLGGDSVLVVGRFGIQYLLIRDLGDSNDWPILPGLIVTASQGQTGIVTGFARRRWSQAATISLMTVAMDCASGVSPERRAIIRREAAESYFGDVMNVFDDEICRAAGAADLGEGYRSRFWSSVPTLFVSGTLDVQTPPHQAEEIRWGFPLGRHLIVEHAGHESTLPLPEVRELVVRFLRGEDVEDRWLVAAPPRFRGPGR